MSEKGELSEREKAREREALGISEEVQHALSQFQAVVSDVSK